MRSDKHLLGSWHSVKVRRGWSYEFSLVIKIGGIVEKCISSMEFTETVPKNVKRTFQDEKNDQFWLGVWINVVEIWRWKELTSKNVVMSYIIALGVKFSHFRSRSKRRPDVSIAILRSNSFHRCFCDELGKNFRTSLKQVGTKKNYKEVYLNASLYRLGMTR